MRVLHVTDFYLPRLGGIEMQVSDLAARQAAAGHDVQVMTCSPAQGHADEGDVQVIRLARSRASALAGPGALREAASWLSPDLDVVHVHVGVGSPLGFWVAREAARSGLPVVITVHSVWWRVSPIFHALYAIGRWSRLPVQWTAVSEVAAEPVRRILRGRGSVSVLSNGIDVASWHVDAVPGCPDHVVIGAVMRLAARKRPLAMIDMLDRVRAQLDPSVTLRVVVVGDGPQRSSVERELARRGMVDWVQLAGRLGRDQIRELYRRTDVFLAPADLESFGIAALEARCAGIPVVAKRAGGISEFVEHGASGLLGATDDDLVTALLDLCRDPGLRQRLAGGGVAQHVDWPEVLAATEAVYGAARSRAHEHLSAGLSR